MIRTKGRSCEGKVQYTSKTKAEDAIRDLRKRKKAFMRMTAYRCGHCGFWHIGHKRFGVKP